MPPGKDSSPKGRAAAGIQLDQPELAGLAGGFGAIADPQLAIDVSSVALDGMDGDQERVGNRLIGHSHGDVAQQFQLAVAERLDDRVWS